MFEVRGEWIYWDGVRVTYRPTPNLGRGRMAPSLIVMHDTADHLYPWDGLSWLTSKSSKVSAHVHIDRDGHVVQLAPLDRVTYHAGISSWRGRNHVNSFGIGIELDNPGRLHRVGNKARAWFGEEYPLSQVEQRATAEHGSGLWMPYTDDQIESVYGLIAAIGAALPGVTEVVRHCDVSPGRKVDANPLLDMDGCRQALFGAPPLPSVMTHESGHPLQVQSVSVQQDVDDKDIQQIRQSQARLNELGFNAGLEDGIAGTKTRMAISGFQDENGLPVTRELDAPTRNKLQSPDAKPMPTATRQHITAEDMLSTSRTIRTMTSQQVGSQITFWSGVTTTVVATVQSVTGAIGPTGIAILIAGFGGTLMWIGLRNGWFARQIKSFRVEDTQLGRHVS